MFPNTTKNISNPSLLSSCSSIDESAFDVVIEAPRPAQYVPDEATAALITRARAEPDRFQTVLELAAHREQSAGYLAHGYQADFVVSDGDIRILPRVVESENTRKPGLNLVVCPDDDGLRSALTALRDAREATAARLLVRPNPFGHHHFLVDAFAQPGQPISLIEIEPVDLPLQLPSGIESKIAAWGFDCRLTQLRVNVQKSDNDCIIFSLSHALKCHAHADSMRARHLQNLAGKLDAARSGRTLPVAFYKHIQTSTGLQRRIAERGFLQILTVNRRGQTLSARFIDHLARDRRGKIYSISIELKRLRFLDRAIAYFSARPDQPR